MRNNSVSIAKALAIILMVLAHTWFLDIGNKWINMFHMPLFFFFAGYCFKDKYLTDFKTFAVKRITGLYKPYVKWSLIFLVLHNVFYHLNIYNGEFGFRGRVSELYSTIDFLKRGFIIVTTMVGHEQLLGGYWFMKSLFVGSFIGYITIKYIKSPISGGASLLILVIISSALKMSIPYFGIDGREIFAALFFVSGYLYKKSDCNIHTYWWTIPIDLTLVTIGVIYWQCTLLKFNYTQVIPFFISATAGILMTFYLSTLIERKENRCKKMLVYIGDNTLTIFTWHFLSFKLVSLCIIYIQNLQIGRLAEFPVIAEYSQQGWFIMYLIVGMGIPLVFTKIKFLK